MARIHSVNEHVLVQVPEHNYTNSGSGSAVDTLGFHNAALSVVATTGASGTLALTLQGSLDNSAWTTIGAVGTVPVGQTAYVLTSNINVKNLGYRYYRVVRTVVSTVNATNIFMLASPDKMPVTQDNDGTDW